MGHRLVINVFENHEADLPIANCYFHWDAYTRSTLRDTFAWFQAYKALENISDPLLRTVRAFEHMKGFLISKEEMETIQKMLSSAEVSDFIKHVYKSIYKSRLEGGAGSTTNSLAQLQNKYPDETFQPAVDRNEGLIGVTKDDIEESMNWAEGSVYIYLDDMTWDFDVYYLMDEKSRWNRKRGRSGKPSQGTTQGTTGSGIGDKSGKRRNSYSDADDYADEYAEYYMEEGYDYDDAYDEAYDEWED